MAEPRASWTVLEDPTDQAGLPLHKVLEDDECSGKNALAALGFKNSVGKLRYPLVDGNDRLVVAGDANDTANLSARGEKVAGSATLALVTGALIDLVNDLTYNTIGLIVSCFRDAHFQLIFTDSSSGSPVETILADVLVDAGQPTYGVQLTGVSFVAGATGAQTLSLKALNLNALSALRGTISAVEVQPAPIPTP